MKKYDYIFLGAGCAGLSLLMHMHAAGLTKGKKILVIDRSAERTNDRTWCFWEKEPGFFDAIIAKKWDQLVFSAPQAERRFATYPYEYKLIRGIDFYRHCLATLSSDPSIEWLYGAVTSHTVTGDTLQLSISGSDYLFNAPVIFNSAFAEGIPSSRPVHLLQHFKGWMIETASPVFDPGAATLMDFTVNQEAGTSFVYTLPFSPNRALVEYTVFSPAILPDTRYNQALEEYIKAIPGITGFTVLESEFGVIPMTNSFFPWFSRGMYNIGSAGGRTKPSSGYTFRFIQQQSAAIVQLLQQAALSPASRPADIPARFTFYDDLLLQVLDKKYTGGREIFTDLFSKNQPESIFKFLDNESSPAEELRLISTLPVIPFLRAAAARFLPFIR